MDKKLVLGVGIGIVVLVALFLFVKPAISGGSGENWERACSQACSNIPVSADSPAITEAELTQGRYYGSLDQKKPGTPATWRHFDQGTRSAEWFNPETDPSGYLRCDCAGRI